MRILFMGTPDIAASALGALLDAGLSVVGAVTQPDKPRGRGHKLTPPEVKVLAEENSIPVYQPEGLKNGELKPVLEELKPDLIVVVAYGKILPEYVLEAPEKGCINLHVSLLPKYRGAAPIQWAVLNGDEETGITTMRMDAGMDTGDILLQKRFAIGEYETSEELFDRMAEEGGKLLVETIHTLDSIVPVAQEHDKATHAPMITKEMGKIDWNQPAKAVSKWICGMNSWPVAYTNYQGEVLKIYRAKICSEYGEDTPGKILCHTEKKGLKVACKTGSLYLQEVQFAGSKRMHPDDYLRGHSVEIGTVLE
ncbi:MAG: methionyl-tRNA formyltransferase [Ruminococcaceae bacterium]|nr:methionyl-tRNA formyltransferase [Oscillospiraceae bacterium]